jgi:4-nitrophenyl phosphatase
MIGDRLDTDIAGGHRAGLRTILCLSGVTTAQQAASARPQPDAVVDGLSGVAHLLRWH